MKYDVIIIGGGPTGINNGIHCSKAGLSYLILEKGVLVNSIYNFPVNMTFFSTSKKLEIGNIPFISHNDKPTRREALEYYRRIMESFNLNIEFDTNVIDLKGSKGNFEVLTEKETYQAKHIIISTGFYDKPRLLNIPGEQLPKVKHYYDDVHLYLKKNVVVIGGANSACDVALECLQKGAKVTMIVRSSELYERVKYWILPNIKNRIKEGSITAYFNSEVTHIYEDAVEFKTPQGIKKIDNDFVLAMTGYTPDLEWLKLLGIKVGKEGVPQVNEYLESSVEGVYLAGVVVGGELTSKYFIENTRHHPEIIVENIVSN
jgi:thioredoxin reductase (NADPH)